MLTSFFVLVAVMLSLAWGQPVAARSPTETLVLETANGRHEIRVEVAETDAQKALGLMFRTDVPTGTGMLFPHDEPREITMWMRNTYVSLDMIFITAAGIVHRVEHGTTPMSEDVIASKGSVTAVLELKAGEARRLGVGPGTRVLFRTFASAK